MKCCILYTGSYNLTDFSLESHTILFNLLKENKIEFDVYISVANEIHIKAFNDEDISRRNQARQHFATLVNTYNLHNPTNPNELRIESWKTLEESYVKEKFENIVGKENIKHIDYINSEEGDRAWAQNDYPYKCDKDLHFVEGLFENNFYKRTLRLANIIPKETYDMFVQLRPDFKITNLNSNHIIQQKEKCIKYYTARIDFIYFSNFIFTDYLNKTNYNNLLTSEDSTDPESLLNIKKNKQYQDRMGSHLLPQYFNKFNIDSSVFGKDVGDKMDCYTVLFK